MSHSLGIPRDNVGGISEHSSLSRDRESLPCMDRTQSTVGSAIRGVRTYSRIAAASNLSMYLSLATTALGARSVLGVGARAVAYDRRGLTSVEVHCGKRFTA
jgi:hypothetical protein